MKFQPAWGNTALSADEQQSNNMLNEGAPPEPVTPSNSERRSRQRLRQVVDRVTPRMATRLEAQLESVRTRIADKLGTLPQRMHRVANETSLVLELLEDYRIGVYREIPWPAVAVLSSAVLYSLSPIDVIPDTLPILGLVDETVVVAVAVRLVRKHLHAYCRFKGYAESDYF